MPVGIMPHLENIVLVLRRDRAGTLERYRILAGFKDEGSAIHLARLLEAGPRHQRENEAPTSWKIEPEKRTAEL